MQYIPTLAAPSERLTPNQVADLLAVVLWADIVAVDEVESFEMPGRLGLVVARLESLLVSLRPVAHARADLAVLDGGLLLDGFEIWAARQRAAIHDVAPALPESL